MRVFISFAVAKGISVPGAVPQMERHGPLPPAAKRLVTLATLRVKCAAAKICNVDVKDSRAVFYKVGSHDIAFVRDLKGKTPDRKLKELIGFAAG